MNVLRPLLIFAGKFLAVYILLIFLVNSTSFQQVYRDVYLGAISFITPHIYQHAVIKSEKIEAANTGDDIQFTFANQLTIDKAKEEARQTGQNSTKITGFKWSFNTYRVDLMFLLFLIALIAAYPAGWKSQLKAFFFGIIIYYLLSFSLFYGRVLLQINNNKNVFPEYHLSSFSEQVLSTATNMHTEGMFFFVLLLWGVLMLRKKDFLALSRRGE